MSYRPTKIYGNESSEQCRRVNEIHLEYLALTDVVIFFVLAMIE